MKVILAARINCAPFGITSVFKHHLIRRIHHTADARQTHGRHQRCDRAFMGSQGLHLRACLCRKRLVRFCGQLCVSVHQWVLVSSVFLWLTLCVCLWTGSIGCWVRISRASFSLCFLWPAVVGLRPGSARLNLCCSATETSSFASASLPGSGSFGRLLFVALFVQYHNLNFLPNHTYTFDIW